MSPITSSLTKDFELCLEGGRKWRTLVGVSFSMECRRWVGWRLSGCGVDEMGRNMGGAEREDDRDSLFNTVINKTDSSWQALL